MAEIYKRPPVRMPRMPSAYNIPSAKRDYYYIFCKVDGRVALLGPHNSPDEAYGIATSKLNTPYEIIPMNTRDRGEATRRLRMILLDRTSDLSASLSRMKHSIG